MEFLSALIGSGAAAVVVGWLIRPRSRSRTLAERIDKAKALSVDLPSDSQHSLAQAIRVDALRLASLSIIRWNFTTTTLVRYVAVAIAAVALVLISIFNSAIAELVETYETALSREEALPEWIAVATSALLLILGIVGIRYAAGTLLTSIRERWVIEQMRPPRADDEKPGWLTKFLFAPLDEELFPRYEAPQRSRRRRA